jgi:ribosomal-protein-alanine N-acetyltransferase
MTWFRKHGLPSGYGVLLEGPKVRLRPPADLDFRAWCELREASRSFLLPWEPTWPSDATTQTAYRVRLRYNAREWRSDQSYGFFIFRREDGQLVGGVTLGHVRRGVAQAASLGYWVGAAHQRRGYMTVALALLVEQGFGPFGLRRIEAACLPENAASRGLLIKLGFREEGRAREYLKINGRWQDHLLFALLAGDPRRGVR